jgi:hypothetical protein
MPFPDWLVFCVPAWVAEIWGSLPCPQRENFRWAAAGIRSNCIVECSVKKGAPKIRLFNRIAIED